MQGVREDKLSYLPLALALPVVAVAVVVATGGGPSPAEGRAFSSAEKSAIGRTKHLLAGIPQHGSALGDPEAPVTLQFYGDLQCVDSRRVMLGALPFLIRRWVRSGDLRIIYRSTETDTHDPAEFRSQQGAAMAAGRQGKMWTFVDLFYREQRREFTHYADDAYLEGIAEQAGVDVWRWKQGRETGSWARRIETDEALAWHKQWPERSTPAFLIGPTGGEARPVRHFSLEEPKIFDGAIEGLL